MNIIGIAWIGMVSDDPAMRHFYQHILGLKLLDESDTYAYYQIDPIARLEILARLSKTAQLQHHHAPAIGFLVENIEQSVQELKNAHIALLSDIQEWRSGEIWHRWVYFADPAGNTLLLLERHGDE